MRCIYGGLFIPVVNLLATIFYLSPKKIENEKLFFLVHCIKKDSLSEVMSFDEYIDFVGSNKISRAKQLIN